MQIDNFHFENNDLKHSVPKSNNLSKKILAYRGSFFCKHTKTHTNKGRTEIKEVIQQKFQIRLIDFVDPQPPNGG